MVSLPRHTISGFSTDETVALSRIRVAVLCDYLEEGWPSMDLVGSMIVEHLNRLHGETIEATAILPPFRSRLGVGKFAARLGRNADRMLNRHVDYPRLARRLGKGGEFDLFHIVDHSYAHLVGTLPRGRAVVTCHDLDAFRCLLEPEQEPRPSWFRALARRTLRGVQDSAFVAVDSMATLRGLVDRGIVPESRVRVVHLGTHPECSSEANPEADLEASRLLGPLDPVRAPELLHVGSNIPRKRVDVLLDVFAKVRHSIPGARLVKVGGVLPPELASRADHLGITGNIATLPPFSPTSPRDRATLAAVYRRAALVLQPSEAEGFGLPVAEAMACGVPVLASDIPVLREVAGDAAEYRPVGDVDAWSDGVLKMLNEGVEARQARRVDGLARSRRYGWASHVEALAAIYRDVLGRDGASP
jgi:glycosyltransferase involved in cell wall biosynthesis